MYCSHVVLCRVLFCHNIIIYCLSTEEDPIAMHYLSLVVKILCFAFASNHPVFEIKTNVHCILVMISSGTFSYHLIPELSFPSEILEVIVCNEVVNNQLSHIT